MYGSLFETVIVDSLSLTLQCLQLMLDFCSFSEFVFSLTLPGFIFDLSRLLIALLKQEMDLSAMLGITRQFQRIIVQEVKQFIRKNTATDEVQKESLWQD